MATHLTCRGALTVEPPLNSDERDRLLRLAHPAGRRSGRPGSYLPWAPSDDGARLTIPDELGTPEPVAEWAAYLQTHLLGPARPAEVGSTLAGFTRDHTMCGRVEVQGPAPTDRWTLDVGRDGVTVERTVMPCPACWTQLLISVRPTRAYQFLHPVREANLLDGSFPDLASEQYEDRCVEQGWTPTPLRRAVAWPWHPDLGHTWWADLSLMPDAKPFEPRWDSDDDDAA